MKTTATKLRFDAYEYASVMARVIPQAPAIPASSFPRKSVDWSYPTSANAKRFGFAGGCWTVEVTDWTTPTRKSLTTTAISGHTTKEEALSQL